MINLVLGICEANEDPQKQNKTNPVDETDTCCCEEKKLGLHRKDCKFRKKNGRIRSIHVEIF